MAQESIRLLGEGVMQEAPDDCDCGDDAQNGAKAPETDVANTAAITDVPSSGSLAEYRERQSDTIEGNDGAATTRSGRPNQRQSLGEQMNQEAREVRLVDSGDAGIGDERVRIVNQESDDDRALLDRMRPTERVRIVVRKRVYVTVQV